MMKKKVAKRKMNRLLMEIADYMESDQKFSERLPFIVSRCAYFTPLDFVLQKTKGICVQKYLKHRFHATLQDPALMRAEFTSEFLQYVGKEENWTEITDESYEVMCSVSALAILEEYVRFLSDYGFEFSVAMDCKLGTIPTFSAPTADEVWEEKRELEESILEELEDGCEYGNWIVCIHREAGAFLSYLQQCRKKECVLYVHCLLMMECISKITKFYYDDFYVIAREGFLSKVFMGDYYSNGEGTALWMIDYSNFVYACFLKEVLTLAKILYPEYQKDGAI